MDDTTQNEQPQPDDAEREQLREDLICFISGLSPETIERLGGIGSSDQTPPVYQSHSDITLNEVVVPTVRTSIDIGRELEREAIVKWLREHPGNIADVAKPKIHWTWAYAVADAIERGAHNEL